MADIMQSAFSQWLDKELASRGWSQSEAARRGEISSQMINAIINGQSPPGLESCKGISRAFRMPLEDVLRLAEILPAKVPPRVRSRRIVYQVDEVDEVDEVVRLWHELSAEDQGLVRDLMVRLVRVTPRIIGGTADGQD